MMANDGEPLERSDTDKTDPPKFFGVEMEWTQERWIPGWRVLRAEKTGMLCICFEKFDNEDPRWARTGWLRRWGGSGWGCQVSRFGGKTELCHGTSPQEAVSAAEQRVRARVRELAETVGLHIEPAMIQCPYCDAEFGRVDE